MHSAQLNPTVQKIAKQSNVNPSTVQRAEQFANAVINWIIDNQLARRNINELTRAYLIGTSASIPKFIIN